MNQETVYTLRFEGNAQPLLSTLTEAEARLAALSAKAVAAGNAPLPPLQAPSLAALPAQIQGPKGLEQLGKNLAIEANVIRNQLMQGLLGSFAADQVLAASDISKISGNRKIQEAVGKTLNNFVDEMERLYGITGTELETLRSLAHKERARLSGEFNKTLAQIQTSLGPGATAGALSERVAALPLRPTRSGADDFRSGLGVEDVLSAQGEKLKAAVQELNAEITESFSKLIASVKLEAQRFRRLALDPNVIDAFAERQVARDVFGAQINARALQDESYLDPVFAEQEISKRRLSALREQMVRDFENIAETLSYLNRDYGGVGRGFSVASNVRTGRIEILGPDDQDRITARSMAVIRENLEKQQRLNSQIDALSEAKRREITLAAQIYAVDEQTLLESIAVKEAKARQARAIALVAASPEEISTIAQDKALANIKAARIAAETAELGMSKESIEADVQALVMQEQKKATTLQELKGNKEYIEAQARAKVAKEALAIEEERAANRLRTERGLPITNYQRVLASGNQPPFHGAFRGMFGNFFGGGFETTLRYALPSMVLFAGFNVIQDSLQDAAALQRELALIRVQINETFGEGADEAFASFKKNIYDVSRDIGVPTAELAKLARQIQATFKDSELTSAQGIQRSGEALVESQVEAAAKLAKISGFTPDEITNKLTAASNSFGVDFERIGDVVTKMEESAGVLSRENIDFLAAIGPAAEQAGFTLEEFASISTSVLKRTGESGASLGEKLGRAIPTLLQNPKELLDLIASSPQLTNNSVLISAVGAGDLKTVFQEVGREFGNLDRNTQNYFSNLFGGAREAQAVLAAFADRELVDKLFDDAQIENSVGSLEKRIDELKKTFGQIASEIRISLQEIVNFVVQSGIGDVFGATFRALGDVLKTVSQIVQVFAEWDDQTGNLVSTLIGLGLVIKGIQVASSYVAARGMLAGAETATAVGGLVARQQALSSAAAAQRVGFLQGFLNIPGAMRESYMGVRNVGLPAVGPLASLRGAQNALMASGAALRTGALGLTSALGGPVGVAVLGVTALSMAHNHIQERINETKSALEQEAADAAKTGKSAAELRDMARTADNKASFWDKLFGDPDYGAPFRAEAARLEQQETRDIRDILSQEATEPLNEILRDRFKFENTTGSKIDQFLLHGDTNEVNKDRLLDKLEEDGILSKEQAEEIRDYNAMMGDHGELEEVFAVLDQTEGTDSIYAALQELADRDNGVARAFVDHIVNNLGKYSVEEIVNKYKDTAKYAKAITEATNAKEDDPEIAASNAEAAQALYDQGLLSFSKYLEFQENLLSVYAEAIESGDNTPEIEQAYAGILKAISERRANRYKELAGINAAIIETTGQDQVPALRDTVAQLTAALNDSLITDRKTRQDIAMSLLKAQNDLNEALASKAQTLEEYERLMSEAMVDPAVRQAIISGAVNSSPIMDSFRTASAGRNYSYTTPVWWWPGDRVVTFTPDEFVNEAIEYRRRMEEGRLTPDDANYKSMVERELQKAKDANDEALIAHYQNILDYMVGQTNVIMGVMDTFAEGVKKSNKEMIDKLNSLFQSRFSVARAMAGGDPIKVAQVDIAAAQAELENAYALETEDEKEKEIAINNAKANLINAQNAHRQAQNDYQSLLAQVTSSRIRDPEVLAQLAIAEALRQRRSATTPQERAQAEIAYNEAVKQAEDARIEVDDARTEFLRGFFAEDPVKIAELNIKAAEIAQQVAQGRGIAAQYKAAQQMIEANRQMAKAMADIRQSQFAMREAELKAAGDEIGAARHQLAALQQQLQDARARNAGEAEINGILASITNAEANVRDTTFNHKKSDYEYLYELGKITRQQFIEYLRGLQSAYSPATRQFKDLELQIHNLTKETGDQLQFNLPNNIKLPTLYEARRLNQSVSETGASVGYQDNRQQNVTVYVTKDMSEQQILDTLDKALGGNRRGGGPRLY